MTRSFIEISKSVKYLKNNLSLKHNGLNNMLGSFVPKTNKKWMQQGLISLLFLLSLCGVQAEVLTLDETCVVSVLNRTVQASSNGSWQLDNVPIRRQLTCPVRDN